MKTIAMIPARYAASRFPGKLLQMLGDKTVIAHTYLATFHSGLFDEVVVVTDSDEIASEIARYNGQVVRSKKEHECGSDRIAEVCGGYDPDDIIVNVQGDEPFTNQALLASLITLFKQDPLLQVASLRKQITDKETEIDNPNVVKVVCDLKGNALLFSRAAIPYHRDHSVAIKYYKHIGIYAFRQSALLQFAAWAPSPIELLEKQEAMRFLENGIAIKMLETDIVVQGIDTPEDLVRAHALLHQQKG